MKFEAPTIYRASENGISYWITGCYLKIEGKNKGRRDVDCQDKDRSEHILAIVDRLCDWCPQGLWAPIFTSMELIGEWFEQVGIDWPPMWSQ